MFDIQATTVYNVYDYSTEENTKMLNFVEFSKNMHDFASIELINWNYMTCINSLHLWIEWKNTGNMGSSEYMKGLVYLYDMKSLTQKK